MVHAQAAHMVNIYELGNETNGVATTAATAAAAVTAAVAATNQDVEESMINELDEEELCVMHGRFMTTQPNNANNNNASIAATTSITTAKASVTSTTKASTKTSTLTPSTPAVTTNEDISSSFNVLDGRAENILPDNVYINGIANGDGDCNNDSDSEMKLTQEVKLNGSYNSISDKKEVSFKLNLFQFYLVAQHLTFFILYIILLNCHINLVYFKINFYLKQDMEYYDKKSLNGQMCFSPQNQNHTTDVCKSSLHPATKLVSTTALLSLPIEDNHCPEKEATFNNFSKNDSSSLANRKDMSLVNSTSQSEEKQETNVSTLRKKIYVILET